MLLNEENTWFSQGSWRRWVSRFRVNVRRLINSTNWLINSLSWFFFYYKNTQWCFKRLWYTTNFLEVLLLLSCVFTLYEKHRKIKIDERVWCNIGGCTKNNEFLLNHTIFIWTKETKNRFKGWKGLNKVIIWVIWVSWFDSWRVVIQINSYMIQLKWGRVNSWLS